MTLNSFTSVSLEPLLVCVSLARASRTLEILRRDGQFGISVLHAGQRDVARAFAQRGATFPDELTERYVVATCWSPARSQYCAAPSRSSSRSVTTSSRSATCSTSNTRRASRSCSTAGSSAGWIAP